jgi:hypothetical protein
MRSSLSSSALPDLADWPSSDHTPAGGERKRQGENIHLPATTPPREVLRDGRPATDCFHDHGRGLYGLHGICRMVGRANRESTRTLGEAHRGVDLVSVSSLVQWLDELGWDVEKLETFFRLRELV